MDVVYVTFSGEYEDRTVDWVFDNAEAARDAVDKGLSDDFEEFGVRSEKIAAVPVYDKTWYSDGGSSHETFYSTHSDLPSVRSGFHAVWSVHQNRSLVQVRAWGTDREAVERAFTDEVSRAARGIETGDPTYKSSYELSAEKREKEYPSFSEGPGYRAYNIGG